MDQTKDTSRMRTLLIGLILAVLLFLIGWGWQQQLTPPESEEALNPLQASWELSRQIGVYNFTAQAQQALRPRPIPEMIGHTSVRVDVHIDGEVNEGGETRLGVSFDGAGLDPTPVLLVQDGMETYLLKHGEKTPLSDNPVAMVGPNGDYLSYLAAAENVQVCADENASTLSGAVACYTYDLNGRAFAEHIRSQVQAELEANPAMLPQGARINPQLAPELVKMNGQGRVWLDANGLPMRMVVEMSMPEVERGYDAMVKMGLNYTFDAAAVESLQLADAGLSGFWPGTPPDMSGFLMFGAALVPLGLIFAFQRHRWMYNLVASFVIFSMVSVPLVHAATYTQFFETWRPNPEAADQLLDFLIGVDSESADATPAETATEPLSPQEQMRSMVVSESDAYCGKGGNSDVDGDGLAEDAEYCLGTNPNMFDSDNDMISDEMEVAGAQIPVLQGETVITQTWYTNPANPDSNGDGRSDYEEWAMSAGGQARDWDLDADGTPNLWDYDDDGDGVPDARDISPTAYTSLITRTELLPPQPVDPSRCGFSGFSFLYSGCSPKPITTTILNIANSYDGYIYISLQVQPKDKDHLRYGMTPLDWARDDKGQIQQLDDSEDDIRLIPMLSVQTNIGPSEALRQAYNVNVLRDTNNDGYSEMLLPLGMVGRDGASVEAFEVRLAYGPDALKDLGPKGIDWKDAKLVWTVLGKNDSETESGSNNTTRVTETNAPMHTYMEEAFRITGLEVTKSGTYRAAVIGTPEEVGNDRQLFQLLFGLSSTYLNYQHPDLDELVTRFENINTPIEEKWGVTATVKIDVPAESEAHTDAGISKIGSRIDDFMTAYYSNWDTPATVILAAEMSSGSENMDSNALLSSEIPSIFAVELGKISLVTQRTLNLSMRQGWKPLIDNELAKAVTEHYTATIDSAVNDLQDQYPDITASELMALTIAMYGTWEYGRSGMLQLDGNTTMPLSMSDADVYQHIFTEPRDRHNDPANIRTLPGYLVEAGQFARKGGGFVFSGGSIQQYLTANSKEASVVGFSQGSVSFIGKINKALLAGLGKATSFSQFYDDKGQFDKTKLAEQTLFTSREDYAYSRASAAWGLTALDNAKELRQAARATYKGAKTGIKALSNASVKKSLKGIYSASMKAARAVKNIKSTAKSSLKAIKAASKAVKGVANTAATQMKAIGGMKNLLKQNKLGAAAAAIDIALSVTFFFVAGDFSGQAIAMLIAQIIFAIMMFALSTIPPWIGTVLTIILGLIDLFLWIFGSDFSISGWVTNQIAKWLYKVEPLTEIADFKLLKRDMYLVYPDKGYVVGNTLVISDTFRGVIKVAGTEGFGIDTDDIVTMALTGGAGAVFIIGQKLDLTGKLQSLLGLGRADSDEALRRSWMCGEFTVEGWPNSNKEKDQCPIKNRKEAYNLKKISKKDVLWTYDNPMYLTVELDRDGSNQMIPLQTEITSQVLHDVSIPNPVGFGAFGRIHWTEEYHTYLPKDLTGQDKKDWKPEEIYVDILPQTVGELWNWEDEKFANRDPDGDGMTTKDEITYRLGSEAYSKISNTLKPWLADKTSFGVDRFLTYWDAAESATPSLTNAICAYYPAYNLCDSSRSPFWLTWDDDGDGLSDKFEYEKHGTLGTNSWDYDSDLDGLNDGLEFQLGTNAKNKDSDGDGLTDAEEIYHYNETTGQWEGGWEIELFTYGGVGPSGRYTFTTRVVSNPNLADTDGDGLNDASEKRLGTSPTALNRAPYISVEGEPLATSPGGLSAVWVKPGDEITLETNIKVFPPFTVANTLSLQLPGNVMNSIQSTHMNGSRWVDNVGTSMNPRWSFANQILQPWFYERATTPGYADNLSYSDSGTATLTLPFRESVLEDSQLIIVDAERPTFQMMKPRTGELIGGGVTDYVIGGSSGDVTTWVTDLRMNLPYLGWQTIATRSVSLSPWAYTWELPSDGVYTLQGYALDFVGNDSYVNEVEVMVDNTPPTVTVDLVEGTVYGPPQDSDVITITLNGTASENYSGLTRVQISTDDGPWREVWRLEDATSENTTYSDFGSTGYFHNRATGATWSATWTLPNVESVQGYHSLRIRAFDAAGNWPQYLERNIIVDVLPPTSELTNRAYLYNFPHLPTNVAHTFDGVANDVGNVPQPSRPAELVGSLDAINDATIWLGFSSITEDDGGVNVQWIGDFNGDRRKDLLVGLPAAADGQGRVSIIYGRAGDWPVPNARELIAGSKTSFVGLDGAGVGIAAAPAGDFNGDGRADLIIGDATNNRAFLIFGQPVYLGSDISLNGPKKRTWIELTPPSGQQIGDRVGPLGDINGDGYADVFIGGTDYTYLLMGQPRPSWQTMPLDIYAGAKISGTGGAFVGVAGDLNGDFRDEFALGIDDQVHIFRGSSTFAPQAGRSMSLSYAATTFDSADAVPTFAALGDVNGDHFDDFIYTNGSQQHVVMGDDTLDDTWTTEDFSYGAGFVAAAGDVDADGLDDILIGGSSSQAFLILGNAAALQGTHATISGVAAAASTPFAINADLNSDLSSDLLLIPTTAGAQVDDRLSEGEQPIIPPMWVPQPMPPTMGEFVSNNEFPVVSNADAYVNGSGDCRGPTPCYSTIQAAVDAVSNYDLVIVQPGSYDPFTVSGKDYLTVQGMDTDTVFVDAGGSGFAAKIMDADGVTLKNMTLRNAHYGVQLDDAGERGFENAYLNRRTQLDHLLIYDVNYHNIYIDHTSTVSVTHSTLANSDDHVGLYTGDDSFDPNIPVGWTAKAGTIWPVDHGGDAVALGTDVYVAMGGGEKAFIKYDAEAESWHSLAQPGWVEAPGTRLAAGSDDQIYMVTGPAWHAMGDGPSQAVQSITVGPNGHVYVAEGYAFGEAAWEWDGSSWTSYPEDDVSGANASDIAISPTDGKIYMAGASCWSDENFCGLVRWNGSGWEDLLPPRYTNHLEFTSDGTLYATNQVSGALRYNGGTSWSVIGDQWSVFPNGTLGLYVDPDDNVYFAERFTGSVKRWDGSTWTPLGAPGTGGTIRAMTMDPDGNLYACGDNFGHPNVAKKTPSGSWELLPPIPGTTESTYECNDIAFNGSLYAVGEWFNPAGDNITMVRWDHINEEWEVLGTRFDTSPSLDGIAASDKGLYISGNFEAIGNDTDNITANEVAEYRFYSGVYSPTNDSWSNIPYPPGLIRKGSSFAGTDDGHLALIRGGGTDDAYFFNIDTQEWDYTDKIEDDSSNPVYVTGSAMTTGDNGRLYAITSGGELCESTGTSIWCWTMANIDEGTMGYISDSAAMTYDPKYNLLYAFPGGNSDKMLRYSFDDDAWALMPAESYSPERILGGAGLVYVPFLKDIGGAALYATRGGNTSTFWQYPLPAPNKVGFEHSAIVVPAASNSGNWLNLEEPLPLDFNFSTGVGSQWFNSTGEPNDGKPIPRSSSNPFLDQSRGVYRLAESGWNLGYHTYVEPMTATTETGIQSVLNSGTNRVVVQPGYYEEALYLPNGVELIGGNPEWTIINPVGSGSDPLVRIDGAAGASISNFTLDAEGSGRNALYIGGNARHAEVNRSIVSGANTGILVDGDGVDVSIANLTVARNTTGLNATNCASIDVRNSIFAYHTGAALSHQNCADTKLHTYNLFWANGSDFGVDADAGAGELFLDPNFVDPTGNDYRTMNYSPVIDAGNPTDPAPPGSGNRADIGYVEQGRANFYVDDSYCQLCVNDGLTWQVDAFDNIQDALDAAEATLQHLKPDVDAIVQLTVGVAPGTYNENVSIPSRVLLLGSGAEVTTIDGGGGTAVTFDRVVNGVLSGFTVTGGTAVEITNASNSVVLYRNIIKDAATAVELGNRATGQMDFNTVVNNDMAVSAVGAGVWLAAQGNIFAANDVGFYSTDNGQVYSDYNLLNNTENYSGTVAGPNDLEGLDPQFKGGGTPYRLTAASPALNAASVYAAVPEGGGTRADLGYSELLADPISLMLGREDLSTVMGNSGVYTVEYSVVAVEDSATPITETLPGGGWLPVALSSPGETVSYWQAEYTPLTDGVYRFYSRATDMVGNQETDEIAWYEGSFVADSRPPTVTWLSPADTASIAAPLELRAEVSDYAAGRFSVEEKDLFFVVDGVRYPATWAVEPWRAADGGPRTFRAWITPTTGIYNNVQALATDKADNSDSDTISFTITSVGSADTTDPILNIVNPVYGGWVSHTTTISGTVSDGQSGVASVEVSVDGGVTFYPATVSGENWSLLWTGNADKGFVSYPAVVRAKDMAGNTTITPWLFTVDEFPPDGLAPVSFNYAEGTHFDMVPTLVLTWNAAVDGSGLVTTFLTVDTLTDTIPADIVTGTTTTRDLDDNGAWYVHLGAMDAAGNMTVLHYGPWHVGISEGVGFSAQRQSIIVDGYIDTINDEWRLDKEYLDRDERTSELNNFNTPNGPQSFYTAWDQDQFYLAWQGAYWAMDGSLWIYLNTDDAGGSSQFITPLASAPEAGLPFAADYAVEITDPLTGTLWEYNGGWQESADDWDFVQGGGGDTEIKLPLYGTSNVETLAFGLGDDGNIWAVFPATNPLSPYGLPGQIARVADSSSGLAAPLYQLSGWQTYSYNDITTAESPAADQPKAVNLELAAESVQSTGMAWGPNNTLQYVARLINKGTYTLTNQPLTFELTPPEALTHISIAGASCSTTNPWDCTVAEIPVDQVAIVTLTTQLVSNLSGISDTLMTIALTDESIPPDMTTVARISHDLDNEPPLATVTSLRFVGLGAQSFSGYAHDGVGVGVDYVEVRPSGGNWQHAEGTEFWSADLTVNPFYGHGDIWTMDVRAVDSYGQPGATEAVTFTVDLQGPELSFDPPGGLTGNFVELAGTVNDDSEVQVLLVQLDGDGLWREAGLFEADENGDQPWRFTWNLPVEDGVTHTLTLSSTDVVGNIGTLSGGPQKVFVDNVNPVISATQHLTQVLLQDYRAPTPDVPPVLTGTAADGGGIAGIRVTLEQPNSTLVEQYATWDGKTWAYRPTLSMNGNHLLTVRSVDTLGNESLIMTFSLSTDAGPDANTDMVTTFEDQPLVIEPLANDIDLNGDPISMTGLGQAIHGTAATSGTAQVLYTPPLNFNGTDVLTYSIIADDMSDTGVISVTVTPVNDAPIINQGVAVPVVMSEDGDPLPFDLALGATDIDGDVLTWTILSQPDNGAAAVATTSGTHNLTATFNYTPLLNYNGRDSFVAQVSDGDLVDTIQVSITIQAVDDPPVIFFDGDTITETMSEDSAPVPFMLTLNAGDIDSGNLTWRISRQAAHGTAAISSTYGSGNVYAVIDYRPQLNYNGSDRFQVEVDDGNLTRQVNVDVIIQPVNDTPTILQGSVVTVTMSEDSAPVPFALSLDANDIEGETLSWSIVSQPEWGTAAISATYGTLNNGAALAYTPTLNYNGPDRFRVRVSDGRDAAYTWVNIVIEPVRDAPVVVMDGDVVFGRVSEDGYPTAFDLTLNGSDVDSLNLAWSIGRSAQHGTAAISSTSGISNHIAAIAYTPTPNYNGPDDFTVNFSDGALTATVTVSVTVDPINDGPEINQGSGKTVVMSEDGDPVPFSLSLSGQDIDGDMLRWTIGPSAREGEAWIGSLFGTGNFGVNIGYAPPQDYHGDDAFQVNVSDGRLTDTIAIRVLINPSNDMPQIYGGEVITVAMSEDSDPVPFSLSLNGGDIDGDTLEWRVSRAAEHGTAAIASTAGTKATVANLGYEPVRNFYGQDRFEVEVDDGRLTRTVDIVVEVVSVNDAPTAVDDVVDALEDTPLTLHLTTNDTDIEAGPLRVDGFTQPDHGSLVNDGGMLIYTPEANFNGNDSFSYSILDGEGLGDNGNVTINVAPVNDAPQGVDDKVAVLRQPDGDVSILPRGARLNAETVSVAVLANDHDLDGDALNLSAVGVPNQGGQADITDNALVYTPAADFIGTETITYTLSDGSLNATARLQALVLQGEAVAGSGQHLVVSQAGIEQQMALTVEVPTGLDPALMIVYQPLTNTHGEPEGYRYSGLSFMLDAYVAGIHTDPYTFTRPITLTLRYDPRESYAAGLQLYYWRDGAWHSDGITLLRHEADQQRLVYTLDHLTEFAMFRSGSGLYLPLIVR